MPPRRSIRLYPKSVHDLIEECVPIENDACVLPKEDWERWTRRQTAEVLLVNVIQGSTRHTFVVDRYHTEDEHSVYLPNRCIHEFDSTEDCSVEVVTKMPPIATKITLEPLDSDAAAGFDLAASVSMYLSHWTLLKIGTILTVPCQEVEGYTLDVIVKGLEPEEQVLLRGEVPLEVIQQESVPVSQNVIVPIQKPSIHPFEEEDFDTPMIPSLLVPSSKKAHMPYQGSGYQLGS